MKRLRILLVVILGLLSAISSVGAYSVSERKFSTTVNYNLGFMKLVGQAVGERGYINPDINPEHFKLTAKGVREVNLELVPILRGETPENCAKRLEAEGYTLENTPELAAFFQQYPEEVAKHNAVFALGKDSQWTYQPASVVVPYAFVFSGQRYFSLDWLGRQYDSVCFVLVSRK